MTAVDLSAPTVHLYYATNGTHEDTVAAAATAALRCYRSVPSPRWRTWVVDGRMPIAVRSGAQHLVTRLPEVMPGVLVESEQAVVFAGTPAARLELPSAARAVKPAGGRLPVAGQWPVPAPEGNAVRVILNGTRMGTGSACVHAAHGLLLWWLSATPTDRSRWMLGRGTVMVCAEANPSAVEAAAVSHRAVVVRARTRSGAYGVAAVALPPLVTCDRR